MLPLISGLIITTVGCILHFVYNWTKKNKIAAIFSAVNESTWEHIKIALVPTFVFFVIVNFIKGFQSTTDSFLVGAAACLLTIILGIPLIFYSYRHFTKKDILFIDILIFAITVISSQFIFFWLATPDLSHGEDCLACASYPDWLVVISMLIISLSIISVLLLTLFPPKLSIFKDPRNKKYGLEGNEKAHSHHKIAKKRHH